MDHESFTRIFHANIFLNTNLTNNTNIFKHTDIIFLKHTDLTDLTDFEPSARCERQLIVNDSSL